MITPKIKNGGSRLHADIFWTTLGISNVPHELNYLGKISYGLYVFHAGMLRLAMFLTNPLKLNRASALYILTVDCLALLLSIVIAHISYQHFEKPFIKLKKRFEVIHFRPA